MLEIFRKRIEFLDEAPFAGYVKIHQVRAARPFFIIIQINFHPVALFVEGRATIGCLELDTVVARGVMGGGDHHACDGMQVFHCIRDGGGGRVGLSQVDDEAIGSQDTRHISGVAVGEEARIEADHKFFRVGGLASLDGFIPGFGCHRIGDGLAEHAQVGKCKGIRDDGAPAVGTKMDGHRKLQFEKKRRIGGTKDQGWV